MKDEKAVNTCINCGENISKGGHYVPPCFGDPGFFYCKPKEKCMTCGGKGEIESSSSGRRLGAPAKIPCPTCKKIE